MREGLVVLVLLSGLALAVLTGWAVVDLKRGPKELFWIRPWQLSQASQWQMAQAARGLLEAFDSWRTRETVGVDSGPAYARMTEAAADLDRTLFRRHR